ncbi:DUF4012 domain-containing protein [Microbacterium sp. SORGH_AS_0888]|uniref:DUF4012 domain-containing protein n=1 Tax=Microbacterium sp. SORGH_AS_0888 TaxID=3041791 RepID=UPI00278B751C|nr:DUF4012 domain-containing protein [Microbacterium sp. SORGH_AS_0888]MDQ1129335.1 hypothetical protein [Microbacterium sp. SORGH_AS_0888]
MPSPPPSPRSTTWRTPPCSPSRRRRPDSRSPALRPTGGHFDVAALTALQAPAAQAAAGTASAAASVDAIDTPGLLPPLARQIDELRGMLDTARTATDALNRATALMPDILGASGPRNYLVVFQNNAEWRSLGGIIGAMAMIHTENGEMSLTAQGSSSDFTRYRDSVVPLSDEITAIMGQKPGVYIQNPTQIPDFAVGAPIAQEMWQRHTGVRVDGVISLDPVTLSYVLAATGPITLPTGDVLTSDNAVALLLNGVYERYSVPAEQDAFFKAAAAIVFQTLAKGSVDPAKLVEALARAGAENRVLVWSADPAEQAVLDGTTLQGGLPVTDATTTGFGVYVNDGTGSKMDFYTHLGVGVGWCTDTEGSPDAALTVTVRSDAPADAASLPSYITGGGGFGVRAGITRTVAYLYLPAGSEVVFSTSDGPSSAPGFGSGTNEGRPVLTWTTDLPPGGSATARIRVRTPQTEGLTARVTPVIPANAETISASCSSAG